MKRTLSARHIKSELKKRIKLCENYKKQIKKHHEYLKSKLRKREINYEYYKEILNQKRNRKTSQEWINFYENYAEKCKQKIKEHKKERFLKFKYKTLHKIIPAIILIALFSFLIFFMINIKTTLTGFAILNEITENYTKNIDLESTNSTEYEFTPETEGILSSLRISGTAELKNNSSIKIYLDDLLILSFEKTEEAPQNESSPFQEESSSKKLEIKEFQDACEETCNIKNLNLNSTSYKLKIEINNAKLNLETISYEIIKIEIQEQEKNITEIPAEIPENITEVAPKNITEETHLDTNQSLNELKEKIKSKKFSNKINITHIEQTQNKFNLDVDFKTQNSETGSIKIRGIKNLSKIEEIQTGIAKEKPQKIKISTEVIAINISNFTDAKISLPKTEKVNAILKCNEWNFESFSCDNWIKTNIPVIENETEIYFTLTEPGAYAGGIIEISKAEHLDENKTFISDIYNEVKSLDTIWSETIKNNEYVRVVFQQNLTKENDITIFPKIISGNPKIEVYEVDKTIPIAEFSSINDNQYNKVFLTNLQNSQDTFDLKIIDGDIKFNHIIDPPPITIMKIDVPITLCGAVNNVTTIWINASGILNICPYNTTNGTGYVNISLGIYGNFTLEAGGQVRANGTGGTGGASATTGNATQGTDGNKTKAGTTSRLNNIGGGGGGEDTSTGDSAAGCGGGFGGAGGRGGKSATLSNKNCSEGVAYNGTRGILLMGSGGGGQSGDSASNGIGGAGGGGIIINAGSGIIQITGLINVSGKPGAIWGTSGDNSGGGGGSGGHVILNATTLNLNSGTIYAMGGKGGAGGAASSDACGGGGGGGGVIVYLYQTLSNTGLTNDTSGGALGGSSDAGCSQANATAYKDTAGSAGVVYYNLTNFPAVDLTLPIINITYPTNNSNFSSNIIINYTLTETNVDKCWWTNNSGITNKSITCGTNISGQGWIEGINNVTIYANDSWYNENSSSVTFRIDTQPPYFNEILPNITIAVGTAVGSDINATDSGVGVQAYKVNDTTNFKINNSGFLENATVLSVQTYNLNISVNDSVGNQNSSLMFVNVTSANNPPQIISVFNNTINVVDGPNEAPLSTNISFNFTVYDANGITNLNDSSAYGNFTKNGGDLRENLSCQKIAAQSAGNYANYTCGIMMWWWDLPGTWNISVYIKDNDNNAAQNETRTFSLGATTGFILGPSNLIWPAITPNTINQTADNDPVTLNNTGNVNITAGNIQINATNLRGETDNTLALWAENFSVGFATGTNAECALSTSTIMNRTVWTAVGTANLTAGNFSKNDGYTGQEQLYFCLRIAGSELTSQAYSTSNESTWTIRILLVALIPARKRKKKSKSIHDDKLMTALNLIIDELKEEYSLNKKEMIKIIIEKVSDKYNISKGEIKKLILDKQEIEIPLSIFSKELGGLEAISKYLKENIKMNYNQIASLLKRDSRTIWTAYNKAKEKQKDLIKIKDKEIYISTNIFKNKELTILESIVIHLREKGLKYSEMGKFINRDQRNLQTIYSRAVKKLKRNI